MEYLTTSEMAVKWNITRRRITTLCEEGRIECTMLKGGTWLIPANADKPEDGRHYRYKKKDE